MSWFTHLPPEIQTYLWGAAADGTGGLAADFAVRLIAAGGARLRKAFQNEPAQTAVQRAMLEAVSFAFQQWQLEDNETEHYQELFRDWLLSPVTVGQFNQLLSPRENLELDIELLEEEFEAVGFSAEHMAIPFAELVQDMAAAFYLAAREEAELQPVISLGLLEKMVDQGGALARMEALMVAQVSGTQAAVDELKQIKLAADQIAAGSGDTNALLKQILTLLDNAAQKPEQPLQQQITYQQVTATLNKIELLPEEMGTAVRGQLLDILIAHFNLQELGALAFRLNINPDRLEGDNLDEKVMSLIGYMERRGRLPKLVELAKQERPQANWLAFSQAGVEEGQLDRTGVGDLEAIWERLDNISRQLTAPDVQLDKQALQQLTRNYCQLLVDQFEKLTFQGLAPSGTPIALPLSEVYVELKAVAQVPEAADTFSALERRVMLEMEGKAESDQQDMLTELDALRAQRWRKAARQDQSQLQRRSIQETLNSAKDQGVVILGDPGSGKTTLLHYLALQAAQQFLAGSSTRLPIFLPLAAYDDHLRRTQQDMALGDFLATYYERWHSLPGLKPLFDDVLEQGEALVLLDGLDEVLDVETRRFVGLQVDGLIRRWLSAGNRFALSSRIVGYREAPLSSRLPHVTIVDFGSDEVKQFATQWCLAYELWLAERDTNAARQTAERETRELLRDIGSNKSLKQLAASPLLITMLALLRRHVGKLPDRRVELYQQYTRTLIDNWEKTRSYGARQLMLHRLDPHQAIAHLMDLALWLQQNKASGTARRHELESALTEICLRYEGHDPTKVPEKIRVDAQQQAVNFLRDMRHFAGLLAERGRDAFGFLHLTFQEYFVGRALARMEPEQRWTLLQTHLHDSRWREPLLLCAGQLGVVEQRRDLVTELTRNILVAESEHEAQLHRDKFLAAAIAADNVALAPAMLDEISLMLQPLTGNPVPTVSRQAWEGLVNLAQLNHNDSIEFLLDSLNNWTFDIVNRTRKRLSQFKYFYN